MKYTKRFLALFLALCMMLTSVPLNVNATEGAPSEVATEAPAQDDDQTVTEEEPSETVDSENTESTEKDEEDSETVTSDEDVVIGADQSDSITDKDSQDTTLDDAKPKKDKPDNAKPGKDKKEDLKPGKDKKTEAEEIIEEVPAIYASRDAAEEPVTYADTDEVVDAAIIFTDLHSMYNGDSSTGSTGYKRDLVTNFMTTLKNTGLEFSSVTSGGDAFSSNSTTNTGYTDTITGYIQAVIGEVPVNYVWSDHDRGALNNATEKVKLDKTSHLTYGAGTDGIYGTDDDANYYVYALSMADICSYDRYKAGFNTNSRVSSGFTPTIEEAIANFKADAAKLDKSKPLFIVSHQPLFDRRNDNAFAEEWFDAINKVAESMDVAFFFGHNHKYDKAEDYFYAKGSKIPVATDEGWKGYETGAGYQGYLPTGDLEPVEKELNFTHMCAGYMDPGTTGTQTNTTREGAVMAITIYEDSVNYCTYGQSGIYTKNYAVNETVTRDHAVADTPDEPEIPEDPTTVPEGYYLERIEVVNQGNTKYYLGEELNKEGLSVVAVYTKADEADVRINIDEATDSEEGYVVSGYNADKAGKQYVKVSYEGCVGSFAVEVFQKIFTNDAGDVTVEFTNYGITAMKATSKVKEVEGYKAYVTYDITPTGYTQGDDATVTVNVDTDLFDESLPVRVLDKGKCIASTNILDGKITFTTNHFSEYDVMQADIAGATWVEIPGGTKQIFRLANTLTNGKKYLIANTNAVGTAKVIGLNANKTNTVDATVVADSAGNYIEAPNSAAQWTYTSNKLQNVSNVKKYLRGERNNLSTTERTNESYTTWEYSNDSYGLGALYYANFDYYRYLHADFTIDTTSSKTNRVYMYEEDTITIESTYVAMSGSIKYNLAKGQYASESAVLNMIRNNTHVYTATDNVGTNAQEKTDYTIEGTVNPDAEGTYTLKVKYGTVELGTITVNVADKIADSISVNPKTITVERDTPETEVVGTITVKYPATETEAAKTEEVPLTIDMLQGTLNTGKNGTYSNLSVTYAGKTEEGLTLKVVNKTGDDIDDFPVYPNPGSIDLKKSAAGVDFQNTGVARVELSTSGLPAGKGADVIIMLDTSSSMTKNEVTDSGGKMRSAVLEESLKNLITQFKTSGPNGTPLDIDVAIADFNGYYGDGSGGTSRTPYDRTSGDYVKNGNSNGSGYQQPSEAKVYTGDETLGAGAFVEAKDLANTYTLNYTSGTNYDYAFDAIYQLGTAIKAQNGDNEKPLYVIFMSDGASLQWNYFGTQNTYDKWNDWLAGNWKATDLTTTNLNSTTHSYFYDLNDHDNDGHINEHRMANAIKGDPNSEYEIIRKSTAGLPIGTLTAVEGKDYLYKVPGLGATMFTINFDAKKDGNITVDSIDKALKSTASDQTGETQYYYKVTTATQLNDAFEIIGTEVAYAATNARYVDQMGSSFNLQMNPNIATNAGGTLGTTTTNTDITITTRLIYTKEQVGKTVNGHVVTTEDVGKPYGGGTPVETVTFHVDGNTVTATTSATGHKLPNGEVVTTTTNILREDVIYGKNFFYNASTTSKTVTLANGSTYDLPAETFYWNIGTINEKQYTMAYTVVLDGAMDGQVAPGSYDTNNFAVLYYTNHVDNEVSKSVASPSLAWKGAQVSYAFYLVNDKGEPVHADGTAAANFLQAYKVTRPVVYKNTELNKAGVTIIGAEADNVLPQGYSLFAKDVSYTVTIGSGDGQGAHQSGWTIAGDDTQTTYVMGHLGANDYTKEQNVNNTSYDYTRTTVYFAVKWVIGTVPDTVVVDYGLDVDVNVIANDMFGKDGTLHAVGLSKDKPTEHGTQLAKGFSTAGVDGSFGRAAIKNGKVRYALDKSKGMQMNDAETLAYAVDYEGNNPGFYYGDLTIIPATTVYYEDEYVTLKTYNRPNTTTTEYEETTGWPTDSKAATDIQAEDRPGYFSLGEIDANNIYGYDAAYGGMSTFSMDSAAMIHVDAKQYGTAEFEFYGTGFDVISATSNNTGTLVVQVYKYDENGKVIVDAQGNPVVHKSQVVDTYYGYVYGLYNVVYEKGADGLWKKVSVGEEKPEGTAVQTKADLPANAEVGATATIVHYTWKPVTNNPNTLYQVPVIKVDSLGYGKYKAKISALYYSAFDHTDPTGEVGYDLYLDAIRIYNPAGTADEELGDTIENAYKADGEYLPSYQELRNIIIEAEKLNELGSDKSIDGIAFIDGNVELNDISAINGKAVTDYKNFGPNNELYLASGQAVAFKFSAASRTGYNPVVRIGMKTVGGESAMAELWNVTDAGIRYNTVSQKLDTATDMYYDISVLNGGNIVITNTGDEGSILSITNIKTTYRPVETSTAGLSDNPAAVSEEAPMMFSVSRASVEAALMSFESEMDEPEVDEPEMDEPEENEPEIDEPKEEQQEAIENVVNKIVHTIKNVLKKMFGRWF